MDEIRTYFHDKGFPPEKSPSATNSITLVDLVYRSHKSYYPEVLLKKCIYVVKTKAIKRHMLEDLFDCDSEWLILMTFYSLFLERLSLFAKFYTTN